MYIRELDDIFDLTWKFLNEFFRELIDFRSVTTHNFPLLILNRDQFCFTCFSECITIYCLTLA